MPQQILAQPPIPADALPDEVSHLSARLRRLALVDGFDPPPPGGGATWERWTRLAEVTRSGVSLGRLAEGHADALAILAEAGSRHTDRDRLFGVWAAEGPGSLVTADPASPGGLVLRGRRAFCSGARTLTHALVTARRDDDAVLVLVDLRAPGVAPVPGTWQSIGMADTDSLDVTFDEVRVAEGEIIGPPGFYLGRRGFWLGGLGVAACWWGGAAGVADQVRRIAAPRPADPHRDADVGAIEAELGAAEAVLVAAAQRCDSGADGDDLRRLTLAVRATVVAQCRRILERSLAALGSGPLCREAEPARRMADLGVYLTQHHGERDHEALGRLVLERRGPG